MNGENKIITRKELKEWIRLDFEAYKMKHPWLPVSHTERTGSCSLI